MSQAATSLPPSGPPPVEPIPWENRDRLGLPNAWVENFKLFALNPTDAFQRAASAGKKGDFLSPLLWAIILGVLIAIVNAFWGLIFTAPMLPMFGNDQRLAPLAAAMSGGGGVFQVVLAPFFVAIGLFVGSAIYHLALMVVGGLERSSWGFEGTLRVAAYAYTAQVASVVPFVGWLIALVWAIILTVLGFERMHQTSQGKAIAAALIPLVVCCLCGIVALLTVGASIAGLAGMANH